LILLARNRGDFGRRLVLWHTGKFHPRINVRLDARAAKTLPATS
jgi:hypothetical protein